MGRALLVHRHRDFPEAGWQVPAGTVDDGETPEAGVMRETQEEAGLDGSRVRLRRLVGRYVYGTVDRFVFHLELVGDAPMQWEHTVSAGEADQGLVFCYEWWDLKADLPLAGHQGDLLAQLVALP